MEDVISVHIILSWEPPDVPGDFQGYLITAISQDGSETQMVRKGRYEERQATFYISAQTTYDLAVSTTTGTATHVFLSQPVLDSATTGELRCSSELLESDNLTVGNVISHLLACEFCNGIEQLAHKHKLIGCMVKALAPSVHIR